MLAFLPAEHTADACGCLSPPAVTAGEFAVNQRAEQIIFEVEPGWVTAHVLIKYAGAPDKFAWLIPVPEAPELAISPSSAFGLIDRATAPDVSVDLQDICPVSAYQCKFHEAPHCGGEGFAPISDASASSDASGTQPPVDIIDERVIGDYETVTFKASEAGAAVQWLRDNGFVVNPTTSIYMESYVQANMVFVAAKLVPGAGIDAIKPLRLRYRAAFPMIPLVITAVAAEPHLTVNAFVYSNLPFKPMGHPIVTVDPGRIAQDRLGRTNYPMVLARTIDEAGGDGFAIEYRGGPVRPDFGQGGFCCGSPSDLCNIGGNGRCECPRDEFDHSDCATTGDIVDGIALVDSLAAKHGTLTRITTRISAEEMTFDPTFEADFSASLTGRLSARGTQPTLTACSSSVVDHERFAQINTLQACASLYCGHGECAATDGAAGCACEAGYVAQRFLDVDSQPSVTCVPRTPPVDLRAGGQQLPDACAGQSCGLGRCVDRNGVAVCECDAGAAAVATAGDHPRCDAIQLASHSPGAQNFADELRKLDVCAPAAPQCGDDGWLVEVGAPPGRTGVACNDERPSWVRMIEPPERTCADFFGCAGCSEGGPAGALGFLLISLATVALIMLPRRRRA